MNYNREDVPLDIIDYIDELKSQNENKTFELTGAQTEIWRLEAIEKQQQQQIEQLREALQGFLDAFNGGYEPSLQTVFIASKALEETK